MQRGMDRPLEQALHAASARTRFAQSQCSEQIQLSTPICWKFAAFGDVLRNKKVTLVCSIGDSLSERRALVQNVRYLSRSDCIIWGKSIKLIERPNLAQLAKQLELVENALPYMFGKEEHEDLMMTMELLQEL